MLCTSLVSTFEVHKISHAVTITMCNSRLNNQKVLAKVTPNHEGSAGGAALAVTCKSKSPTI
jgi:hypothetical protein